MITTFAVISTFPIPVQFLIARFEILCDTYLYFVVSLINVRFKIPKLI